MQTGSAVQGANTIPRRRWPNALRALVVIAFVAGAMVLLVWVVPPATSGVGANDAPKAGVVSTVVHEDAGNYPLPKGKLAPLNAGAGSAVIHNDAGSVNR